MSDNKINIIDLKDITLQTIARKHDVQNKDGVLEGQELLAFNNELKTLGIVTQINNLQELKNPQKFLSDKNIITVVENYSKNSKEDTTIFGAFMKDDTIPREDRKRGLLATFNIFYNAIYATTKTQAQKEELLLLKNQFEASIQDELDNSWFEWGVDEDSINEIVKTMLKMHTASSEELAGEIFDYIDDTNFSFGDKEFSFLLDSINEGNVVSVAQKIKQHPANSGKESLLKILAQEYTFPFDSDEANEKKTRINKFVIQFFQATNYDKTPYMAEAKKLLSSIINSTDTGSNVLTGDIDLLDSLMESILTSKPKDIAQKLYNLIDDNSFAVDRPDVRVLLDKINVSNINEILNEFKLLGDKKSLITMLDEEWVGEIKPKDYINKIILAQLDTSPKSKDPQIKKYVQNSLSNEPPDDTEMLMDIILDEKPQPKKLAKILFDQLDDDEDNVNKQVVKYILDNLINKNNITKVLSEFNQLSGNTPLTEFLQDNGEELSLNYLTKITNVLLDANETMINSESFNSTFKLDKESLQAYVKDNLKNTENINNFINAFLPTSTINIAKTIENIAANKLGAADDITFKLWIAKITPQNVLGVIDEYKKMHGGDTPINGIIEERDSDVNVRQALILYVLNAVILKVGNENINNHLIEEFTSNLEKELFGWGLASASKLNNLLDNIIKNTSSNELSKTIVYENVIFNPDNLKLTNVRAKVPELSFGKKYGAFSWQYENLRNIKTLEDVAEFTGLRVEYLEEMIRFEGYETKKYKCSSGKWTIGIGHNFNETKGAESNYLHNHELSREEIYQIFAYDLTNAIHELIKNKKIETIYLKQGEYEALVDVCFNAPNHMKNLTAGTIEAINQRKQNNLLTAATILEQNAFEFNQQYSNGSIVAGLCKRRMHNILRFMNVDTYSELEQFPNARNRIIMLLKNGEQASPFYKTHIYKNEVCQILGITSEEYDVLLDMEFKKEK